jgi:dTDP-glucose pyrophosphorylase
VVSPKEKLKEIIASPDEKLEDVLPRMDRAAMQVLMVADENLCLLGIITDGDIRRLLLRKADLKVTLSEFMCTTPTTVPEGTSLDVVRKLMVQKSLRHIPVLDSTGRIANLLLWQDVFAKQTQKREEKVVIMAGGKGSRLDPFTKILPKPMIPLGDKPILEVIIDRFNQQGFYNFLLSVGYKAEIIRYYFAEYDNRPYEIKFVQEEKPLGTAGALGLLKKELDKTFIVSNSDIIVESDCNHLLEYHSEKQHALTIVGALRKFTIPYGVLNIEDNVLVNVDEKPNFHFLVNTGLYVLEPGILSLVPEDKYLDMTDLIVLAKENNLRVGVYPHHGHWFDVGQWEEYRDTIRFFDFKG